MPVLLVTCTVIGLAVASPAFKHGQVPGVDSLSMVDFSGANVAPASVHLGQRQAKRVGHEDQGQQEPAGLQMDQ